MTHRTTAADDSIGSETHREEALAAINESTREMMDADPDEVCRIAAHTAESAFAIAFASVWRYGEPDGLRPAATAAADHVRDDVAGVFDRADDLARRAFAEQEPFVCTDLRARDDLPLGETLGSLVIRPLGRHGVFLGGCAKPKPDGDCTSEMMTTLAANAESALTQACQKRQLRDKEEQLSAQNETLERLNRINGVIRDIGSALVDASTREEIERVVCERLADSDPYLFAWTGEYDAAKDRVVAREWAGTGDGYLDETLEEHDGWLPAKTAVETNEPQVVPDILSDSRYEAWHRQAIECGFRSCISVPLVYDGTRHGVLNVCAAVPSVFDGTERSVLSELGDTIAHAMNACHSKRALVAETVTEAELRIGDSAVLGGLSQRLDAPVSLERVVPRSEGETVMFVGAGDADCEAVAEAAASVPAIRSQRHIGSEGGDALVELVSDGSDVARTLVERGASPQSVTADGDAARVVVELPRTADVRTFVEQVRSVHPDTELVARRELDRPIRPHAGFRSTVADDMTERQQQALELAYRSGYFDWPRESDSAAVADSLGVAKPTFLKHLRTAERKLLDELFDGSAA